MLTNLKPTLLIAQVIALVFLSQVVWAEQESTVIDEKVGLTTHFSHEYIWKSDTEIEAKESTTCAASPEQVKPAAVLCIKTQYQENSLALKIPKMGMAVLNGYLLGVCKAYQCGPVTNDDLLEKTYGGYAGFEHATNITHPAYKESKLDGSLFFATRAEKGEIVLFSLHTEQDKIDIYRPLFESMVINASYSAE